MNTTKLATALRPIARITDKGSMSDLYKAVEISRTGFRACCPYASVVAEVETGLDSDEPVCVNGAALCSIVESLPANKPFQFTLKGSKLLWSCEQATGQLALLALRQPIPPLTVEVPKRPRPGDGRAPTTEFINALELGGMSCVGASLNSLGLNGVVIRSDPEAAVLSSDEVSVSMAVPPDWGMTFEEQVVTLSQQGAALLHHVLVPGAGVLRFTPRAISYVRTGLQVEIAQAMPLRHDIYAMTEAFGRGGEVVAKLPSAAVSAFIKRAAALAERKRDTRVTLSAGNGKLGLRFVAGEAVADEFFLAEDLRMPEVHEVLLDGIILARALAHVDSVTLDHATKRGVLVFHDQAQTFFYYVSAMRTE